MAGSQSVPKRVCDSIVENTGISKNAVRIFYHDWLIERYLMAFAAFGCSCLSPKQFQFHFSFHVSDDSSKKKLVLAVLTYKHQIWHRCQHLIPQTPHTHAPK